MHVSKDAGYSNLPLFVLHLSIAFKGTACSENVKWCFKLALLTANINRPAAVNAELQMSVIKTCYSAVKVHSRWLLSCKTVFQLKLGVTFH